MTVHYHGTPITPRDRLYELAGRNLCVSFADPRDGDVALTIAQAVLWDNGAFSVYTRGETIDETALHAWLEARLYHPHRAVVLDRIGGTTEEQRAMCRRWPHPRELSWPVWHLDQPLDYLLELADAWPGLCLGSSGQFWKIASPAWDRRMDEAFNHLAKHRRVLPWVHGLRMLGQCGRRWPLSSADSVNVARNWKSAGRTPGSMAAEIDRVQCPGTWTLQPEQIQMELIA